MPLENVSKKRRQEISRKGVAARAELSAERKSIAAKKAAETRKFNATFKEALQWVLDQPALTTMNPQIEGLKKKFPDMTNREAMSIAMTAEALNGNAKAFLAIRDTTGELPEQMVNVKNEKPMTITVQTVQTVVDGGRCIPQPDLLVDTLTDTVQDANDPAANEAVMKAKQAKGE